MRVIRYHQHGGPEVLKVEETDIPTPGPGQVLLRSEAIGANFIDTRFRSGTGVFQRPLPGSPTGDMVGTVEAVGPGVDAAQVGRRVATLLDHDAFADYAVADADWLVAVPDGLDAAQASVLPLAAPVALRVLRTGQLAVDETVLVHAAAGSIGHLAVQLAKILGAGTVIATAGSAAKLDFARRHGADIGIDYTRDDWADQVRAAAPDGVHLILDSVGGATLGQGLDLLTPFGRAVVYGAASGELPDLPVRSLLALRYVVGFAWLAWRAARPEQARQELVEVIDLVSAGKLGTTVHATFPLADAVEAHRVLDERANLGRVLLIP